jgi:hypothetical protein
MNRSLYALAVAVLLLALGFVIFNSASSRSKLAADGGSDASPTAPSTLPPEVSGMPDIEYIPIHPQASAFETRIDSVIYRRVIFEVEDRNDEVDKFYRDTLAKQGWSLVHSEDSILLYNRAEPSGNSSWHLQLEIVLGLAIDNTKTMVQLIYGRYPDIGEGLPVYPDAQQVTTTHSEEEKATGSKETQVYVADKTYLTNASPQQLTDYYNGLLPEYAWWVWEQAPGTSDRWTGDIMSEDGLKFTSLHKGANMITLVDGLTITATPAKDGQLLVTLHAEEFESPMLEL